MGDDFYGGGEMLPPAPSVEDLTHIIGELTMDERVSKTIGRIQLLTSYNHRSFFQECILRVMARDRLLRTPNNSGSGCSEEDNWIASSSVGSSRSSPSPGPGSSRQRRKRISFREIGGPEDATDSLKVRS